MVNITIPDHILNSPGPVACVGEFRAKPGRHEALLREIRTVLRPVRGEVGCELYEFHVADDETIVIYERWATGQDFAAHGLRPQPHLRAYGAAVADLVDVTEGSMSVRWLTPVDA